MINEAEMMLNNILEKMDDKTKNILIKALITHDKKDVWVQAVPVYGDICHEGRVIMRYVKDIKYVVGVKHDVDTLTGEEPHIVWLNKEED